MEKTMSVEDKIKRAEEIYNRRRENQSRISMAKVNVNSKKDIKLFKKMIIQIIVCLAIYSAFYLVKNNNYIFSEDLINKAKEILAYDVNFSEVYSKCMESLNAMGMNQQENENTEEITPQEEQAEGIGGAEETPIEENVQEGTGEEVALTQAEQDVQDIKNSISFIKPIEGTITSTFGWRNPTTSTVPKYHTGLDIAASQGTVIHSATEGDIILASSEGDYRKSSKNSSK